MDTLKFHNMTLTWLEGGVTCLDGGAMFGVVPKAVWTRRYPVNERNQIELPTDPILIQYEGKNYLIDTGLGDGKLTDKQKKIFGVAWESKVVDSLAQLNLTPDDIDVILISHMHFDHASGLTYLPEGEEEYVSAFKNAVIYVQQIEWDEMRNPNIRSKSTYWTENWEAIADQVITYGDSIEVVPGITMTHTGGHSNGHSMIKLEQNGEALLHMSDLFPTHAHQNPLWVPAYDDYPMTSIFNKEKYLKEAYEKGYGFIFYHDAFYRMAKWDSQGAEILDSLERSTKRIIE